MTLAEVFRRKRQCGRSSSGEYRMLAHGAHIDPIRSSSRRLVRELGFMRRSLAGTSLPARDVHALVEISRRSGFTAGDLSALLKLDRSSVRRMLRKLIDADILREGDDQADDGRTAIVLTARGEAIVAGIHAFADRQVADALARLNADEAWTVAEGLRLYAGALARDATDTAADAVTIETGYSAGAIGRCIEMHMLFYARMHGFGRAFEARIAADFAAFAGRMDKPCNRLFRAMKDGRIVGTLAIDGEDLGANVAHLRWFIVDDGIRGGGIGRKLLAQALAFCDRHGFGETCLWTFRGLDAARHLYESHGFSLAEEYLGSQWGHEVTEQRFVRRGPADMPS